MYVVSRRVVLRNVRRIKNGSTQTDEHVTYIHKIMNIYLNNEYLFDCFCFYVCMYVCMFVCACMCLFTCISVNVSVYLNGGIYHYIYALESSLTPNDV
jgi:hypothetical protein